MENQHRRIKGYRELSQEEIDLMNVVKYTSEELLYMDDHMATVKSVDGRWPAIAKTDLQKGFMALTRSIAKPEFF